MPKGYQHLTYEQRCQIYVLLKRGFSQESIAKILGVSQSTISRELKRNRGLNGYRFKQAQRKSTNRRNKASSGPRTFTPDLIVFIEYLLTKKQWSPEQISGWLARKYKVKISHERIYQHIWEDKRTGGTLYKHLRRRGKKYNKRANKTAGRGLIPHRVGIEHRPSIVDQKKRVGDFEIDTIRGGKHKGALLSIVDRKTKLTLLRKLERPTAKITSEELIRALETMKNHVHTLTADNGKEFAAHLKVASELEADMYFARPYHSWERGLNENTNGLVRQYFPKAMDLSKLTKTAVDHVEYLLNTRPRKTLNYRTPLEVFFEATGNNLNYALRG